MEDGLIGAVSESSAAPDVDAVNKGDEEEGEGGHDDDEDDVEDDNNPGASAGAAALLGPTEHANLLAGSHPVLHSMLFPPNMLPHTLDYLLTKPETLLLNVEEAATNAAATAAMFSDSTIAAAMNRIETSTRLSSATSSNKMMLCDTDDPKPGPSNSAADFDLEVFDSGSSCSNEECWGIDDKGDKIKEKSGRSSPKLDKKPSSSKTTATEVKATLCESETEEMDTSDPPSTVNTTSSAERPPMGRQQLSQQTQTDLLERIEPDAAGRGAEGEGGRGVKSEPGSSTSTSGGSSGAAKWELLPRDMLDRKESVELWKSRNETDAIVQDHDVFGTDENDDDSMDSISIALSSSRRGSVCDQSEQLNSMLVCHDDEEEEEEEEDSNNKEEDEEEEDEEECHPSRSSSRNSAIASSRLPPLPLTDHDDSTISSEALVISTDMATQTYGPGLGFSYDIRLPSTKSSDLGAAAAEFESRPKRKSGSLPELGLAALPLKKQRPEEEEGGENSGSYLGSLVDPHTAPTSPASPEPPRAVMSNSSSTPSGSTVVSFTLSPRSLFSGTGCGGRNLIPDKENPPQDILDWVATFSRWSHAERLLAIDQLIDTCEPQQVRHMMQVIEPQFQRDFISLLPKELALYVLAYLEPKDLLRAAQTCRYWRILAEDNLLWREKCKEAGLADCRESFRRRGKLMAGFIYSPWKAGFMRQHNIEMNWRLNPVKSPKVLKGHDDHVITCLQFSGNRIVSGSDDNTLKVWSAVTGKCLRTLVGHTGGVWSSQMVGNIIVSGSTDRTLKVWNAESGTCVHTLYGHTSTVRCMHLHNNKVVSGSRDATLRLWDIGSGECLHVLVGHVAAVRCVQYDGRLVVSGAYDYMVKVWNPEREECLHTLSGHTNRVYSLQFDGLHVVSGSLDTSIRVWDVETGACRHALMGHQSLTSGMELKDNILVSGNADSTVKIWDILSGQCLQTLSGPNKHQSAVTCLQFNKKFVVTSSDDGTVKLWDVKSGEFIRDLVALESGGSGGVVWRIRSSATKLVCAVGSRNGTEETKLLVLDFDAEVK